MAKKKIQKLTPKQYADLRKISLSAVTERIRDGKEMPGVIKVNSFGRFYLLDVDLNQIKQGKPK